MNHLVLPTNTSIMRNGERLINGLPLDNLHCALIVQLYAARKALAKVSDVVTSLDIPS